MHKYRGVNPATGMVIYYRLPAIKEGTTIRMEIRDGAGNLVRSFSNKPDSTYKKYGGAPPQDPVLTQSKGLNRFVWDMRYPTIPGVPDVYIESSYLGHKASPGKYTISLQLGDQKTVTETEILANPLYAVTAASYNEYHQVMYGMETSVTAMHTMINTLYSKRMQLVSLLKKIPADEKFNTVRTEGQALVKLMKDWDEEMVQRQSKAYDDVENFPNKFTAEYMFLMNQTESDIPQVNQPSLDLLQTLNKQWMTLQDRGNSLLLKNIPAFNKLLWDAGIGAIWEK
jgi:hypothetical protein